jgi:bZIP transcription factor
MGPTKKQRTSGDMKAVTKQPNSSYYSVDLRDLTAAGPALISAQRRRAQNRASQRAFRERKERHVKSLEQQLEDLHQQYEELLHAYEQQKHDYYNLKADFDVNSGNKPCQVSRSSPLEFASAIRAQSFQSDDETVQFQHDDLLLPEPQSLSPGSSFENRNSIGSRGSTSEEHTPFGSLLPLTPSGNFDNPTTFRSSDLFFAEEDASRYYDNGFSEAQQESGFGSPTFNKEFAVNPSVEIYERWT